MLNRIRFGLIKRLLQAWISLLKILLLATACLISYLMVGCSTYESAFRKYGSTLTDTTTVSVPVAVTIPRDSAVISVRTDTSRVIIEEHNRTSWVRLYRDKDQTRVEGGCDSATIARDVLAKVPQKQALWGVDPKFEESSRRWRTIALTLISLILLAIGLTLGVYYFLKRFQIIPKNGAGTPTEPN